MNAQFRNILRRISNCDGNITQVKVNRPVFLMGLFFLTGPLWALGPLQARIKAVTSPSKYGAHQFLPVYLLSKILQSHAF